MTRCSDILDMLTALVHRYVVCTSEQGDVIAVWIMHTYVVRAFWATPYLHIRSAEPGSGKTQLLELLATVVRGPELAADFSPAVLYRIVDEHEDAHPPTLLIDEVDAIFNANGKGDLGERADALRGIINSGYKRSGRTVRCVGPRHEIRRFPTYSPKALAGLKMLPNTIRDRSVGIRLERMRPGERVTDWDGEHLETAEAPPIRDALATWAEDAFDQLVGQRPNLPAGLSPRGREIWRPLVVIADHAGETWPERIRAAAQALSQVEAEDESIGVHLLSDINSVFTTLGVERIITTTLIEQLCGLEEAPWGDWRGKPITREKVSRLLRPYGVKSEQWRDGAGRHRGYLRASFEEAWERYLPGIHDSTRDTRDNGSTKPETGVSNPCQEAGPARVENGRFPHEQTGGTGVTGSGGVPAEEAFVDALFTAFDATVHGHTDSPVVQGAPVRCHLCQREVGADRVITENGLSWCADESGCQAAATRRLRSVGGRRR